MVNNKAMTGQELKDWRRKWGLSQDELGRLLGVARFSVSRWEIGTRAIPSFLSLALEALENRMEKGSKHGNNQEGNKEEDKGFPDIERIQEADKANYQLALRSIGDSATLLKDLVNLYNMLAEMIKKYDPQPDEFIVIIHFLSACHYQLNLGALSALRGHLTDSFFYIRKAIEFCAFARMIKEEPKLAVTWLNAGDEEQSYRIYRSKFSQKKAFPKNNEKLMALYKRYDQCSKSIHPSLFSLARHIRVERTNDIVSVRFRAVELSGTDPSEPIRTILWIVDTHFIILKVFEEILSDIIAPEQKRWEVWINGMEAKIAVHKEKWKPIILDKDRRRPKEVKHGGNQETNR